MADLRRLPGSDAEMWDGQLRGACRGRDIGLFFAPERERGQDRAERVARAKKLCQVCAVLDACRQHALAAHEPYGVWGGMSVAERKNMIRGRRPWPSGPRQAS